MTPQWQNVPQLMRHYDTEGRMPRTPDEIQKDIDALELQHPRVNVGACVSLEEGEAIRRAFLRYGVDVQIMGSHAMYARPAGIREQLQRLRHELVKVGAAEIRSAIDASLIRRDRDVATARTMQAIRSEAERAVDAA